MDLTILVATDLGAGGERALALALSLPGRIHLVYVHPDGRGASLDFTVLASRALLDRASARVRAAGRLGLVMFRRGEVARAILHDATMLHANLIVLGDSRGPIARAVLSQATVPVLVASAGHDGC